MFGVLDTDSNWDSSEVYQHSLGLRVRFNFIFFLYAFSNFFKHFIFSFYLQGFLPSDDENETSKLAYVKATEKPNLFRRTVNNFSFANAYTMYFLSVGVEIT
jgi:hypothetical protein